MSAETILSIEAATRQLELAIRLHFQDADVIGVHTLAAAAHGILEDLLKREPPECVTPLQQSSTHRSQRKHVAKMVREATGFLKHADREPERSLEFNPNWTDYLLYDAIEKHIRLTHSISRSSTVFLLWIKSKYPTVSLFDEVAGDAIALLRGLFPRLGGRGTKKVPFSRALEGPRNRV